MKFLQKVAAAVLSALLPAALTVPAFADAAPSEKEEVIYVLTDASGRVTDMEAVNIFAGGDITDYGDYSAVKTLNTNDPITQEGDKITISSSAARVYYQGTMKSTVIPWEISIRYFLDGREYAAEEIAEKSGGGRGRAVYGAVRARGEKQRADRCGVCDLYAALQRSGGHGQRAAQGKRDGDDGRDYARNLW